jgi:small conductance mechanosensitive channel
MVVGISYDSDLKKAKEILNEMVAADERILKDPAPTVAVSELAESSVNFVVRPWVKSADFWAVKFDYTEAVKLRFDSEGIGIPFPQMDVHVHKND